MSRLHLLRYDHLLPFAAKSARPDTNSVAHVLSGAGATSARSNAPRLCPSRRLLPGIALAGMLACSAPALAQQVSTGGVGGNDGNADNGGTGGGNGVIIPSQGGSVIGGGGGGGGGGPGGAGGTGGVGQASGAILIGAGGNGGAGGATSGTNGGNGGDGGLAQNLNTAGGTFSNFLRGGGGGGGGGGATNGASGGDGGAGGGGLIAASSASMGLANVTITGGNGGNGGGGFLGVGGSGGAGGTGLSFATSGGFYAIDSTSSAKGGSGGNGGSTGGNAGGAGGNGGVGISFANAIAGNSVITSGSVAGGAGGIGGTNLSFLGAGGNGGNGGDAVVQNGGALVNMGSIRGGAGGAGGANAITGASGSGGNGGDAINGMNLFIDNAGTVAAGMAGNGGSAGNAIDLVTGNVNTTLVSAGTASLSGNIVIGAGSLTLQQDPGVNATYANIITGAGSLVVNNASASTTVTLTGANTYTGGTTISAGTLQIGDGGTSGSVAGNITDNAALVFNRSDAAGIGGVIDGTGTVTKIGIGTLTLSGTNTYIGATAIDAGTLSVNGSIAASSLTTVNAGGTLGGNGTVGNTTVNGGTLSPGNSIGLLTVQGNLAFTAASSYMVEVSPANADRVNVTGTATLGGATVRASFASDSYVTKQYTILNAANGVIGTFGAQVNTNLPASFRSALSYDGNNAYLDLTLDFAPPAPPGPTQVPVFNPLNTNQAQVGNALVSFFNRTGGIPLMFGALDAQGLTRVSGEIATGSQQTTFDAMTQFMGMMTDPFTAGRDAGRAGRAYVDEALPDHPSDRRPSDALAAIDRKAPPPAPAFEARWNVWAAGFGGSQTTDGNVSTGSNTSTSSIYGTAVGADYGLAPNTVTGFSLAGGGTNFTVASGGSGRSDLFQAGAFVRHAVASAYVTAAAAYGWQDITTNRSVGGVGLQGRFNANSYSGRVELGDHFVTPWFGGLGLTPYSAVQVTALDLPAYAESAAGDVTPFALSYAGKTVTATRSELGLRSDRSFAVNDAMLTLRGRAAWAHDYTIDRSAQATFQSLPGASFVVNGASPARDAALTTASAEMSFRSGISLAATFEGEFSEVTRSYAGKGVVRYAW
jgi:uncharacterized protein with beta-barrel porin domain